MVWKGLKRRPILAAGLAAGLAIGFAGSGGSARTSLDGAGPLEPELLLVRFFAEAPAGDGGPSVALDEIGRIRFVADPAEAADDAAGDPAEAEAEADAAPSPRPSVRRHVVKPGETLSGVASRYGIRLETLRSYNPEVAAKTLRPGAVLRVPDRDGILHRVRRGQTLWDISRAYKVPTARIVEANGLVSASTIRAGQRIFVPGARAPADPAAGDAWAWPAPGRLSSRYGLRKHPISGRYVFHRGVDIAAVPGAPIRAARGGVVVFAGRYAGYGRMVEIRHADGTVTRYAHASRLDVRRGEKVARGRTIGRVGETGHTTGPHLHFEVRRNGRTVDPLPLLAGR